MKKNLLHGLIGKVTAGFLSMSLILTLVPHSAFAKTISKEEMKAKLVQAYTEEQSKYKLNSYAISKYGKSSKDGTLPKDKDSNKLTRVIVQFNSEPAVNKSKEKNSKTASAEAKKAEAKVKSSQEDAIEKIEKITGTKVIRSFGYLINGISIDVKKADIQKISAIAGVKDVTESETFLPSMESAKEITGAYGVWKDYGYKGDGMVVSIIDTGIDYTHKDLKNIDSSKIKLSKDKTSEISKTLGHGKYYTDKVPYGYNYADKNSQIVDSGSMHGMHVAGIVAANGDEKEAETGNAIRGVAPNAQLLAMKVFSNNSNLPGAYADDIIAAIEDSVKLGADVINMSLGASSGILSDDDPEQVAVKNATDAGVLCVISAGNSQTSTTTSSWSQPLNKLNLKDKGTLGNPAVSSDSLSVASYENSNLLYDEMNITSSKGFTKNTTFQRANGVEDVSSLGTSSEVVFCGLGKQDDFKGTHEFGWLSGKIALVERGEITFFEKVMNAFYAGPNAIVIYNNKEGGDTPFSMDISGVTGASIISIGYSDGMAIRNQIDKGDNSFKFESTGNKKKISNPTTGDMSPFSSWGPSIDLEFKPEITAPGGEINSLANNNKYQVMNGTSMAAPHVAGAEALILQGIKDKNLSPRDKVNYIKNTSMNTSKIVYDKFNDKAPISPRRQGAGLIQIENAIKNNVIATYNDKAAAALKEIGKTVSFDISLKNYSSKDTSFNMQNGGILTEVTGEDSKIKETPVTGAAMSFNKKLL